MTNEDKINSLAAYLLDGSDMAMLTYEEVKDALSEMAEWKDQQFKEYLDGKAICAKEKRDVDNLYDWDKWDDIYSAYMQIINEFFTGTNKNRLWNAKKES